MCLNIQIYKINIILTLTILFIGFSFATGKAIAQVDAPTADLNDDGIVNILDISFLSLSGP